MNKDCFVEKITSTKPVEKLLIAGPEADYDKDNAGADAENWFRKIFYREIDEYGDSIDVETMDFNGADYTVTLNQLYQDMQTGNTASISLNAAGELINAVFVQSELTKEEICQQPEINEKSAVDLAQKYVDTGIKKRYGDNARLNWDKMTLQKKVLRTFKKNRYWEIELNVPIENVKDISDEEYYCMVQIDANSGECLSIADPYK